LIAPSNGQTTNDMDALILTANEIPSALETWLAEHDSARMLIEVIRLEDGSLGLRALPNIEPGLVERALVTMAKYREALTNLT
jgi:hypothetical protein